MIMKATITSVNVCVEMTVEQFKRLDRLDFHSVVFPQLSILGAYEVEYDCHFGPNCFFTCQSEDVEKIKEAIEKLVSPT